MSGFSRNVTYRCRLEQTKALITAKVIDADTTTPAGKEIAA
ncbi:MULTISPECIES: hypothetical protein [Corynebacterium]|nr:MULTISPECIES: hypothetical protein [Corynebacterium]MDV2432329.1 hypothetical protein [Corynebacterium tuberculostearicum]